MKTLIVTGAASGIGRAAAKFYAQKGWSVGMIDLPGDRLMAAREEVQAQAVEGATIVADGADLALSDQVIAASRTM